MQDSKSIGLIGVGLLGTAMAKRLLGAGFHVVGHDVDAARLSAFAALGGQTAASAAEVVRTCRRTVLSLPTSTVARAVVDEIEAELGPGSLLIDTTTGDPDEMRLMAVRMTARGVGYLDATVGGSSKQAEAGDVIVMVGGEMPTLDGCRDIFACIARETFHVGPAGNGAKMKLVVNLVLGLNRAALAEGLSFARSYGLDAESALAILKAGPAWSRAMDVKGHKMIGQDFAPEARLSQHLKDVRLILEQGAQMGATLPLSRVHAKLLDQVERLGFGALDNSAIIKAFETTSS